MIGDVWYSSCIALQSSDFWYVLVKIWASAVATTAHAANTMLVEKEVVLGNKTRRQKRMKENYEESYRREIIKCFI